MNIIKVIFFGLLLSQFISILLNVNAIQKYPSKIIIHPLYHQIGGSWFVLMGSSKPSKICHQLNFTETIAEENFIIDNTIKFNYQHIDFINKNTFSIGKDVYEIIYYCPTQNLLIIKNKFNSNILVLSQQIHLEDWEYLYIDVACKLKNVICDNLYLYAHKDYCIT